MNVDYPGQGMFGVGAALDGDTEGRLALFDNDAQVALVVRHDDRGVLLTAVAGIAGAARQTLSAVMTAGCAT